MERLRKSSSLGPLRAGKSFGNTWEPPAGLHSSGDKGTAAEQGVPPKHPQFPGGDRAAGDSEGTRRGQQRVLKPVELSVPAGDLGEKSRFAQGKAVPRCPSPGPGRGWSSRVRG